MTTTAPARVQPDPQTMAEAQRMVDAISRAYASKVVGQEHLRESLLIGLLTGEGGHILIESVPGLAKTTAAVALAESVDATFNRVQCTPDLLPSDIIGGQVFDLKAGEFTTVLGPVHANIFLIDEINRSSAKTQSAMLQAMQERRVTIAGEDHRLPDPFLAIATQNPVDQEGTYPLSEAQTDRFMWKVILTYPTPAEEFEVMRRRDAGLYSADYRTPPVMGLDQVRRLQAITAGVYIDDSLIRYITQIVGVTRRPAQYIDPDLARLVEYGASPRATIGFCQSARALALLAGRNYVAPEDITHLAHRVLRHRLILSFEAQALGVTSETVIDAVMNAVRRP